MIGKVKNLFCIEYKRKVRGYKEKLCSYGVREVDLPKLPIKYWEELIEAFEIMYCEFPLAFQYFEGFYDADIMDMHDVDSCMCCMYRRYEDYQKKGKLGLTVINIKNTSTLEAEEQRRQRTIENYHKCDSFKSYIIHELTHFVENAITFATDTFMHTLTDEWFSEYVADIDHHKTGRDIMDRTYGTIEGKGIIGEEAYGSKNASEFLAEAVSEYFCLDNHQAYMSEMYVGLKNSYNKYFVSNGQDI